MAPKKSPKELGEALVLDWEKLVERVTKVRINDELCTNVDLKVDRHHCGKGLASMGDPTTIQNHSK
jgi:hypothetical protein